MTKNSKNNAKKMTFRPEITHFDNKGTQARQSGRYGVIVACLGPNNGG